MTTSFANYHRLVVNLKYARQRLFTIRKKSMPPVKTYLLVLFMLFVTIDSRCCGQTGACCIGNGIGCSVVSTVLCGEVKGRYMGHNSVCARSGCSVTVPSRLVDSTIVADIYINVGPMTLVRGNVSVRTASTNGLGTPYGPVVTGFIDSGTASSALVVDSSRSFADSLLAIPCSRTMGSSIGAVTLVPGVYCFPEQAQIANKITLSGPGTYIFKVFYNMIWSSGVSMELANGAKSCDVHWIVGQSLTMNSNLIIGEVIVRGNVNIAHTNIIGRLVSTTQGHTLNGVTVDSCRSKLWPSSGSVTDGRPNVLAISSVCQSRINSTTCLTYFSYENKGTYPILIDSVHTQPGCDCYFGEQQTQYFKNGSELWYARCYHECARETFFSVSTSVGLIVPQYSITNTTCLGACSTGLYSCSNTMPHECLNGVFDRHPSVCSNANNTDATNSTASGGWQMCR